MIHHESIKKNILKLLREDEEFRLAVAGLVGLREIVEELRELRRKSIEHDKRFEAIEKKLLEHDKRFEAIERKLLEHDEKFRRVIEEIKAIKEDIKRIWEEIRSIREEIKTLSVRVSRVEDSLGALSESTYAKFFLDTVLYEAASRGERVEWRRNAVLDDEDIDLLIVTTKSVYVVEVTIRPKHHDVGALVAKADIVARHYRDKDVIPVLTGTRIGREVAEYASSKGVIVTEW